MFGLGSIGNFLPIVGALGSGFSGGGLLSLGFTMLSGLLTNIGSPNNPGFDNFATHPGFESANVHPGFGTFGGGPNVQTVGNMSGYFGGGYSGGDYSIIPSTPSGQYQANAGYNYGSHAMTYAPTPPPQQGYQNQHYGGLRPPTRSNVGHLSFGGQFPQYRDGYNSVVQPQPPFIPSYHGGQTQAYYGSAPSPYGQGYQPVMSHYGFGAPQQYNPATTLFGHQSGSVSLNYGRPHYNQTQGGPQGDGNKTVVHHHHHFHFHNHGDVANNPNYGDQDAGETPAPDTGSPNPDTGTDTDSSTDYGAKDNYKPAETEQPEPQQPPVSYYEKPNTAQPETPKQTEKPKPVVSVERPSTVVNSNPVAAQQTSWGRVPHVNNHSEWPRASKMVAERITGGDSGRYSFGGRDPRTNTDGMMPERSAVWHVFQQNESLRLDLKSGYFYETKSNGSTVNRFHMSAVANIERQAGSDTRQGFEMVGDFLKQRNLDAPGLNVGAGTQNSQRNSGLVQQNIQTQQSRMNVNFPAGKAGRSFG